MVCPLLNVPIVQNPDGKCRDYRCVNVLMPSPGFGHAFIGFDLCSHTMDRPLCTAPVHGLTRNPHARTIRGRSTTTTTMRSFWIAGQYHYVILGRWKSCITTTTLQPCVGLPHLASEASPEKDACQVPKRTK